MNENISEKLSDNEVTTHTASLWKYIPIPDDSPEKYPEFAYDNISDDSSGISVTAARVRGKKHKHEGTNCDDWYAFEISDGMVFAAVSDGAGSKIFSRIGAKTACTSAVEYMKNSFAEYLADNPGALDAAASDFSAAEFTGVCTDLAGIVRSAASHASEAVIEEAEKRRTDEALIKTAGREPAAADFSATLLLTAVIPVKNGENLVISVQIGDGMTAAVDSRAPFETALSLMGNPDKGEFSGETDFITSPSAMRPESIMNHTRLRRSACTDILMMTDGVADDYFPNNPDILRLFLDLRANGIISGETGGIITDENRPYVSSIPHPEKYVWVNDGDVSYEFQYMISVMEKTGLSLKQLWEMPDTAAAASLEAFGIAPCGDTPAERLAVWLDNYVRRGSFDDRTLLIIHTGEKSD